MGVNEFRKTINNFKKLQSKKFQNDLLAYLLEGGKWVSVN